ncbi:MAG: MmgE/PrpD family protein [Alphaproteobacteria bacterium]|jgi:2-methylcitrate dehydratase PrpD
MSVAQGLAEYVVNAKVADISDQALDHAAMLIASTIASAAVGKGISSSQIICALERERGGRADSTLWFDGGLKLPATAAARANAVMSDAAASDDSDLRNIAHMGTPLTAAALATGEQTGAKGEVVLAAMVLGYEVAGRIGAAITPGFRQRGFHACVVAVFSSTVATGRLLGLDVLQMTHAIALSATSVGGLIAAADTSVSREYHAGLATLLGVEAAQAAQRGFTGEIAILEMPNGFCNVYGGADATGILDDFAQDWDIVTDMAIKLAPGGHFNHAMAEAAGNAARTGDIAPDEIKSITLSRPNTTALSGPLHPETLIDMAHSPAYFIAAGAVDRAFSWAHATPEKISDPLIHRTIDKITVGPPPTENVTDYRQGATVTIEAMDGRRATETVFAPNGAGCRGIDWADIDAKYRALASSALSEAPLESSLAIIRALREVDHVSSLTTLLQG